MADKRNSSGAHAKRRPLTEQDKADRAVISVMKDWPLEPGQMLLLGPRSVAALTDGEFHPGRLTDKLIIEKSEWSRFQT